MKILVVGCGCIGLTTSVLLQEAGHQVEIWAKNLPPGTTSNIAGGLIYPFIAEPIDLVSKWTKETTQYFTNVSMKDPASNGSVMIRQCIDFFDTKQPDPIWKDSVLSFRRPTSQELTPPHVDAFVTETVVLSTDDYLQYLIQKFTKSGGKITQKTLLSITDPFPFFDLVVNCTGLGAKDLVNDDQMYPTRGQVISVKNNGFSQVMMDDFVSGDNSLLYIIPRKDEIIIGGTMEKNNWSLTEDKETTQRILKDAKKMSPIFEKVDILKVKVGLRPSRSRIRLETEKINWEGKTKFVVHNYGHGGSGWTVSWGCAKEAVLLCCKAASELGTKSKL